MDAKETARLEAFSDGVFAIAITLLVLELRVPEGALLPGLLHEWPSFLSFTLSFVTILIMWTNHHANLAHVVRADGRLLFANGFLLLMITFVPFPTAVLGQHLADGDARVAAALYAGTFVAINVAWVGFWRAIVRRRAVLAPTLPDVEVRAVGQALAVGFVAYLSAVGLSLAYAPAGVGLCMVLAGFWTFQAMRHHRDDHRHAGSSA
ncbi:MAG TPA: TMEM175 family protein [Candidatus Thermoplasmatota archaeon]|nr:TMEM175 family protein [Candidatus Thermoplasmatota archaeon]